MPQYLPILVPPLLNPRQSQVIAKPDSGASDMYWRVQDKHILRNVSKQDGPSVNLPDGSII